MSVCRHAQVWPEQGVQGEGGVGGGASVGRGWTGFLISFGQVRHRVP